MAESNADLVAERNENKTKIGNEEAAGSEEAEEANHGESSKTTNMAKSD